MKPGVLLGPYGGMEMRMLGRVASDDDTESACFVHKHEGTELKFSEAVLCAPTVSQKQSMLLFPATPVQHHQLGECGSSHLERLWSFGSWLFWLCSYLGSGDLMAPIVQFIQRLQVEGAEKSWARMGKRREKDDDLSGTMSAVRN